MVRLIEKIQKMNPDEKLKELIRLYSKRYTTEKCSEVFDCSNDIILDTLKSLNIYNKFYCKTCSSWKTIIEFSKNKNFKYGITYLCKTCSKEYHDNYYNNENGKDNKSEYYTNNKEKILNERKEFYINNKSDILKYKKEFHENNKEKRKIYNTRPDVADRRNELRKIRRETDLVWKINANLRTGIINSLTNGKEGKSWKELVDFTLDELIIHLKKCILKTGLSWEEFNGSGLELDHIRPIDSFDFESHEDSEFKDCWSLDNFQLLYKEDNVRKSNKYDGTPDNKSFNLKYMTYEQIQQNINSM
jgi:hypothetical protein